MIDAAIEWVNTEMDCDATFAARFDLDEKGTAVVDVFASPFREYKIGNQKQARNWICWEKCQKESRRRNHAAQSFSGFQDTWAKAISEATGVQFDRGVKKTTKGKDYLPPQEFKRAKAIEMAAAEKNFRESEEAFAAAADAAFEVLDVDPVEIDGYAPRDLFKFWVDSESDVTTNDA